MAITALWIGLLQTSVVPRSYTWLLPIYFVVSLGCYGLLMVGVGLMNFPTCPQEAVLLQKESSRANLYGLIIVDWFRIHGVAKLKPLCLVRIQIWSADCHVTKEYLAADSYPIGTLRTSESDIELAHPLGPMPIFPFYALLMPSTNVTPKFCLRILLFLLLSLPSGLPHNVMLNFNPWSMSFDTMALTLLYAMEIT
ncbi:unnamed protein product [Sphenostylis stenocarpa]|uniref:Dolichol-phosphate mannosyltransferase subunit 3 n=1 Tax=Sphenostylis stenocarpa TaxID=92480 RepID=A0AA86S907_9FABA|nr:unnamed protein product [Sphenostylis stenocarpa]